MGLTPRQLQSSRYRQLFQGVHVAADVEPTIGVLAAAVSLLLPPGAVVGGTTGATLHGADLQRLGDSTIDVAVRRGDQMRRRGIRAHEAQLDEADVVLIRGVPVLSPMRTAFDLGRNPNLVEAVVAIDAMLNRGGCSIEELSSYVDARSGWRGEPHGNQWRQDLERQERIRDLGWWHRRYTSVHARAGWGQMVAQVGAALLAAGWRP